MTVDLKKASRRLTRRLEKWAKRLHGLVAAEGYRDSSAAQQVQAIVTVLREFFHEEDMRALDWVNRRTEDCRRTTIAEE